MSTKSVDIIAVCPNCKESVQIRLNKKEAKIIFKSFKMDKNEGNKYRDRELKKCQQLREVLE